MRHKARNDNVEFRARASLLPNESPMSMGVSKNLDSCLGLDWDDTASVFPAALAVLVSRFQKCVIITLNDDLTATQACELLQIPKVEIEVCPWSRQDFAAWKIEMCQKHQVSLMIDDDMEIIQACEVAGIPALWSGVPTWR